MSRLFIRKVNRNDYKTVDYYRELARKNEVVIEEVKDEDALNVYRKDSIPPKQNNKCLKEWKK